MIVLTQVTVSHLITSLPVSQSESMQIQNAILVFQNGFRVSLCNAKKENLGLNALINVHIYYEDWAKILMESKNHLEFQRLWKLVMFQSSSQAMCETVGSIMGQHCAKGLYLDGQINEVIALDQQGIYRGNCNQRPRRF